MSDLIDADSLGLLKQELAKIDDEKENEALDFGRCFLLSNKQKFK